MGYREPGTGPRRAAGGDTEWLTLGQAAKYLGVAQSTIRKWSDLGRVPAFYTPGGHRRYRRTDLDAFLERSGPGKPARGPLVLFVHHRAGWLNPFFEGLSYAGRLGLLWIGIAFVLAVVWRRWGVLVLTVLAVSAADLAARGLKEIFDVERPSVRYAAPKSLVPAPPE